MHAAKSFFVQNFAVVLILFATNSRVECAVTEKKFLLQEHLNVVHVVVAVAPVHFGMVLHIQKKSPNY